MKLRQYAALGLAMIAPLGLSGCLILPGEFTSEMTVMKSGEFSFSYKGQIQLLGLANMLNDSFNEEAESGEFTPYCWGAAPDKKDEKAKEDEAKKEQKKLSAIEKSQRNEAALAKIKLGKAGTAASATAQEDYDLAQEKLQDTPGEEKPAAVEDEEAEDAAVEVADAAAASAADALGEDDYSERECTAEEIAEQKAEWEEGQEARKKRQEEQKKIFTMLLGGIDPKDPKTIERFTKEVERLAGWNKVEHLGDGLFMVDYSTKGQLADDYAFPIIPRYALGQPMIHITRWDNGRLRVEAPAFHSDPDFSLMAMMGGGAMTGMMRGKEPKVQPADVKGTFTLTTDAEILANNTEEGPVDVAGLKKLTWDVTPDIFGPPMALLKLK